MEITKLSEATCNVAATSSSAASASYCPMPISLSVRTVGFVYIPRTCLMSIIYIGYHISTSSQLSIRWNVTHSATISWHPDDALKPSNTQPFYRQGIRESTYVNNVLIKNAGGFSSSEMLHNRVWLYIVIGIIGTLRTLLPAGNDSAFKCCLQRYGNVAHGRNVTTLQLDDDSRPYFGARYQRTRSQESIASIHDIRNTSCAPILVRSALWFSGSSTISLVEALSDQKTQVPRPTVSC